jgi:putative transposase
MDREAPASHPSSAPGGARSNAEEVILPHEKEHKGWHGRGYLPHFDSPECIQHIVFRTFGSLPRDLMNGIDGTPDQRREIYGQLLDHSQLGQAFLSKTTANIMEATLRYHDGQKYTLFAWCIMPNHVHVMIECFTGYRLGDIIKEWKSYSARKINLSLNQNGKVWAPDYFDRFVRNEDQFYQTKFYIENNPVTANLVSKPELWQWSSAYRSEH